MYLKYKAGYYLYITTWENDGDNYKTASQWCATIHDAKFLLDICKIFKKVKIGNQCDKPDNFEETLLEEIAKVCKKHSKYTVIIDGYEVDLKNYDSLVDSFYDLHLFGGEYFFTRKYDSYEVEYYKEDVYCEMITL
jgi:hypothetical protein